MPTPLVLPRHPLIGMVLIAVLLATAGPALTADVTGQASVIDGDTIEIHGTRIRLWGIDAPEGTQLCRGEDSLQYRCGAKAANDLDAFIARSNGLALDWPNYSKGMYDKIQKEAERGGRGMWSGSYVQPWQYRTCIRSGGRPAQCSDDANAHP